jgi:hypothetical protein
MSGSRIPLGMDFDPICSFAEELFLRVENDPASERLPDDLFSFGPLAVELRASGELFRKRLTRAIEFARTDTPRSGGWHITALDGARGGAFGAPPDWTFPLTSQRHLERLHQSPDGRMSVRYNPDTRTWNLVSHARRAAIIWTADASNLPDWDDSAPCRDLFHWMTLPEASFLAHGAAIGINGKGILLAGAGGSGKSTTTAAAVHGGLNTVGDDFLLIDPERTRAHALYDTIKLDVRSAAWFPQIAAHAVNKEHVPAFKARVHVSESLPLAFVTSLPLDAILLPRVGQHARTEITPATSAEALRALVPSTIFLVRGGEPETIRKASSFLRGMPAYHCLLGAEPSEAISVITDFFDALRK